MQFADLHCWELTAKQAVALQTKLAARIILTDRLRGPVRLAAGVDVSYQRQVESFHAAVVVLDLQTFAIVETATASADGHFPYIPGLLSFRELPVLLKAFRKLQTVPEVILVDGQGIAHPRHFGLASHLGLWLDLPTIGCAKSRLCGEGEEPGRARGERTALSLKGRPVGAVVRTRQGVRPMYVSPGHLVSIDRSVRVVLQCGRGYRLPEPTRQAHLASNRLRIDKEGPGGQVRGESS